MLLLLLLLLLMNWDVEHFAFTVSLAKTMANKLAHEVYECGWVLTPPV